MIPRNANKEVNRTSSCEFQSVRPHSRTRCFVSVKVDIGLILCPRAHSPLSLRLARRLLHVFSRGGGLAVRPSLDNAVGRFLKTRFLIVNCSNRGQKSVAICGGGIELTNNFTAEKYQNPI